MNVRGTLHVMHTRALPVIGRQGRGHLVVLLPVSAAGWRLSLPSVEARSCGPSVLAVPARACTQGRLWPLIWLCGRRLLRSAAHPRAGTSTPAAPQALQGGWLNQSGSDSSGGGGSSRHTIPPPTAAAFEQQQHMRTSCRCPSAPATSQSTRQGRWTCGQDRTGQAAGRAGSGQVGADRWQARGQTRGRGSSRHRCACAGGAATPKLRRH